MTKMKRKALVLAVLVGLGSQAAMAATKTVVPSVGTGGGQTSQELYAHAAGELFKTKHAAIAAAVQAWSNGEGIKPIVGQNGELLWPYGQGVPKVTCSKVPLVVNGNIKKIRVIFSLAHYCFR